MDDSKGAETTPRTAGLKKGPWTAVEDAILIEYVKKHGEGNWNAVQKNIGLNRCGKSCRLRPNLKKGVFTPEEELVILRLHAQLGNKWARIAAHLPGRTDNEIKNYWNTRIKRRLRAELPLYPQRCHLRLRMLSLKKGPWTAAEDAILIEYVKKHGEGNWNAVQKNSGLNRCGKSCRLRWANHFRPNLKKGVFTPEEELVFLRLHAQLGNKWARIAAHLPGGLIMRSRTTGTCGLRGGCGAELPLYPQDSNYNSML